MARRINRLAEEHVSGEAAKAFYRKMVAEQIWARYLTQAGDGGVDRGTEMGEKDKTAEQQRLVKPLLYTWKDCFATNLAQSKPTDLIEHIIDLKSDARPVYASLKRYPESQRDFVAKIFPQMEDADTLVRRASPWAAHTTFIPKNKGSKEFRVCHNYIPLESYTIKSV